MVICFIIHGVADGGVEESQLYYTTSFEKKQAGNAGKSSGKDRFLCNLSGKTGVQSRGKDHMGGMPNIPRRQSTQ